MSKLVLVIRHKVQDYAKWRPAFDADLGRQEAAGLRNPVVYRSTDDGTDIVMRWDARDRKSAMDFLDSTELREKMKQAGVLTAPEVFFQESP